MSQNTLTQYDLEELARPLMGLLDDFQDHFIGWMKIHQLMLDGKPVSPDRIATHLGLTQDEVAALLKGAELDQQGNVVGIGLSIVPTPHSYRIRGRQLYTWCAGDAIFFPILHKSTAVIESPDPISGEKIRLTSTPEGVRQSYPGFPEERVTRMSAPGCVTIPTSSPQLKRHLSMSQSIQGC